MRFGLAVSLFSLAALGLAGEGTTPSESSNEREALRAHLERQYPGVEVDAIHATPLDGIYEVISGTDVMYLSGDGRYLLRGSLIDLRKSRNLTKQRRGDLVRKQVAKVPEESMLVYPPSEGPAQHRITVFTDPTCPYCQRLHQDLMALRKAYPLEVRYLMFPRGGLQSKGARQMRQIWCSDEPQRMMTRAKSGKSLPQKEAACETPIKRHYQLAREIGVSGTPYLIVGKDGPVFSGYRPKKELMSMLGIAANNGQGRADSG